MSPELPPSSSEPTPLFAQDTGSRRGGGLAALAAAALLLLLGLFGLYVFVRKAEPPAASAAPAAPAAADSTPPHASLEGTDTRVRELLRGLSGDATFLHWLSADDLVRRFVSAVNAVAEGHLPRTQVSFMAPTGDFKTTGRGASLTIAAQSYKRYDGVARAIGSIDVQAVQRVYGALQPLLLAAHAELAPPGRTFEQSLTGAVAHLTAVSVPSGPLRVMPKGALYVYAEPQLEALSGAQKQLLRMGPDNARKVQAKLTELSRALKAPATSQAAQP